MFFPLLEALLQKNQGLCKQRVHEFLQSGEERTLLYKSLFTYASQQAISEDYGLDALVVSDALVNILEKDISLSPNQQEQLLCYGVDYLCNIPVESIDTNSLKPSKDDAKVVSISDLEESFEQENVQEVIGSVRDLLTLMDNKHYFMEIIYRIALLKSPQSIVLASATSRAMEIMGWQNNFTPFLIYHMIMKLFYDKNQFTFDKTPDVGITFDRYIPLLQSTADMQFMSSAFLLHHNCKILASKIRPKIQTRLIDYFNSTQRQEQFTEGKISMLEQILCRSSILDLEAVQGSSLLRSKIPFAV